MTMTTDACAVIKSTSSSGFDYSLLCALSPTVFEVVVVAVVCASVFEAVIMMVNGGLVTTRKWEDRKEMMARRWW